jgi:uncharacterized protein YjbJ (UPF0337 family)
VGWHQIAGKWSQLGGGIRQQWGKLTDDDVKHIAGCKDRLIGIIQERYGIGRKEAQRQISVWSQAARRAAAL